MQGIGPVKDVTFLVLRRHFNKCTTGVCTFSLFVLEENHREKMVCSIGVRTVSRLIYSTAFADEDCWWPDLRIKIGCHGINIIG